MMKKMFSFVLVLPFLIGIVGASAQTARVQVIHNAADPAASVVDIYLDGAPLLNDFAFRTASPFIDAPAGTPINLGIAPGSSLSANDTIANFQVTLTHGEKYVVVANGVLNPMGFGSNPDGRSTAFTLLIKAGARESSTHVGNVQFIAVHGASDAPGVDIDARSVGNLVNNALYSDLTDYITVPPASYTLDVKDSTGAVTVASFTADLSGLADSAATVFASGFLNPLANQLGQQFGLYAALPGGAVVELPITKARLQIIHNSSDPAAELVDIYLNGQPLLDNFAFRTATAFIDIPARLQQNIGVAPGSRTGFGDTLTTFDVTLEEGEKYVALANGVLNPANFAVNPDGLNTGFTLFVKAGAQELSTSAGNVQFIAVHGATDALGVDIDARGVGNLVNDALYGAITDYITVPPASYTLDVKDSTGSVTVAAFNADLSGLADGAAVVFASGFLDPISNQLSNQFGLFAALPNGTVVEFPVTKARLQVIHNSADPAANEVDIYLNGQPLLNDFAFRTATAFIDVPARLSLNIGVAGGNSTDFNDTLKTFTVSLAEGETYVALATGVLNPASFSSNPDGLNTAFTLFVKAGARESSSSAGNVQFFAVHGATDAPGVDVAARGVATLVDNAVYGDITDYITVPPASYTLDVKDSTGSVTVAAFTADLSGLANGAAAVFASGFLNPITNQLGKQFGLYAALPNGTVVEFPVTTARLQVIHNSADPAADEVDIYWNGQQLLNDFAFRTASPFIDVPARLQQNVGVAPGTSSDFSDTLTTFNVSFEEGEKYVVLANGVLNPASFAANPDGRSTAFTLFVKQMAREASTSSGNVQFFVVHGATDAPAVDVVAQGVGTLVENALYSDITDYLTVPPAAYTLDVKDSSGAVTVATFTADLSGLADGAAAVFASGFLTPSANQNGPAFGLFASLPDGTVVPFSPVTSVSQKTDEVPTEFGLRQNYPNPFNPSTQIAFALPTAQRTSLKVYNLIGQEVASLIEGNLDAGA